MSKYGIREWNGGENFAIYASDFSLSTENNHSSAKYCKLRLLENNVLEIQFQFSIKRYGCFGEWPKYEDGDILYIYRDGSVQTQYSKGQVEVDLFITNKCNSNCIMCPLSETVRRKGNPGQLQWVMKYIDLLPANLPYINITGGEPTLEKDRFVAVMHKLRDKFQHSEFQLLTNGRSLADRVFLSKLIKCMPYNIRVAIPLHSSHELIHDRITQVNGSFKETDFAIRNLLDMQQKVELRIVLSKVNISTVEDTVKYIVENYRGVFVVNFIGMEMMGNAVRYRDILWDDYDIFFQKIRESVHYLISHGIDTQLYNFPLCAVDSGYWPIVAKSITGYKIQYKEECTFCAVREICGGFFYSTLNLMNPRVQVITEK